MGRFHERHPEDFYRTPPKCTKALLAREKFHDEVHEAACGDGAISEVLKEVGYNVYSSDVVNRGYPSATVKDFLDLKSAIAPSLVTNPPYNIADEFVAHAIDIGYRKIALLLRLAWLEGERRRQKIFTCFPPDRIHVFSGRQTLWKGDDPSARSTGGMAAYGWFVWDFSNEYKSTSVHWIPASETQ